MAAQIVLESDSVQRLYMYCCGRPLVTRCYCDVTMVSDDLITHCAQDIQTTRL